MNKALLGVILIMVWGYLAGIFFLVAFDGEVTDASPLTLYQYWFHYSTEPEIKRWLSISSGLSVAVMGGFALLIFAPSKKSLFGDARFARRKEVKKSGLFGNRGLVVGKLGNRLLMYAGYNAFLSARARSGKGVSTVIPNALVWPDSFLAIDVKQEIWELTSAYRKHCGQDCYLVNFMPVDYRTHRYNPLAYVSEDSNFRIDDVQKIANMLLPDKPNSDPLWTATPRTFFLGIVLYLLETPGKPVTLGQVLRETLADGDGAAYFKRIIAKRALAEKVRLASDAEAIKQAGADLEAVLPTDSNAREHIRLADMAVWYHLSASYRETLQAAMADRLKAVPTAFDITNALEERASLAVELRAAKPLSAACVLALNSYTSIAAEKTRSGIIVGLRASLELWMNPLVDAATSANDFDLRDIRKKKLSIYLGVSPDNLERLAPLLNLFFQQAIDLNTRERPEQNKSLKYLCLLLMDEFTAIGAISGLAKRIGYIAGYGLRMLCVIQSPSQLREVYGKDAAETLKTNHALSIIFAPTATEKETAQNISDWLGYETVKNQSESSGMGWFAKKKSKNVSDSRRALMLPQEITGLGADNQLIIMEDMPPLIAKKIRYYREPEFINRMKKVSRSLRALGSKLPTREQLEEAVRKGELSAPVPLIKLESHPLFTANEPAEQTITVVRAITAEDIPNLAAVGLEKFAVVWPVVEKPKPGELDVVGLHAYTDKLYNALIPLSGGQIEPTGI